jgi:hypothetical protein
MSTSTIPRTLTGNYVIDPTHSRIGFVARHAMVTKVRGSFNDFEGSGYLIRPSTQVQLTIGRKPTPATPICDTTCAATSSTWRPTRNLFVSTGSRQTMATTG